MAAKSLLENLQNYIGMLAQGQNDQIVCALNEINKEITKQIQLACTEEDKVEAASLVVEEPIVTEPVVETEVVTEETKTEELPNIIPQGEGIEAEIDKQTETKSALKKFAETITGKSKKKNK